MWERTIVMIMVQDLYFLILVVGMEKKRFFFVLFLLCFICNLEYQDVHHHHHYHCILNCIHKVSCYCIAAMYRYVDIHIYLHLLLLTASGRSSGGSAARHGRVMIIIDNYIGSIASSALHMLAEHIHYISYLLLYYAQVLLILTLLTHLHGLVYFCTCVLYMYRYYTCMHVGLPTLRRRSSHHCPGAQLLSVLYIRTDLLSRRQQKSRRITKKTWSHARSRRQKAA